jgi:hypothetical protein
LFSEFAAPQPRTKFNRLSTEVKWLTSQGHARAAA